MDQLKNMKEQLICQVQEQLGHLDSVDAKELGEVIDMIKDLAETEYYCSITKAMEESEKEDRNGNAYYYTMPYPDYDRERMYYSGSQGGGSSSRGQGSSSSATQMKDLEKYIQDLGEDITEMIQNATPAEKQVLQQKIATLSTKIV